MAKDNLILRKLHILLTAAMLEAEKGGSDQVLALARVRRGISAAAATDIKLENWDDFLSWWRGNQSPQLVFTLIDALGENNPAVQKTKDLLELQEKLDVQLHDLYMDLRSQAGGGPSEDVDVTEEAAPEGVVEDVLEEAADDEPAEEVVEEDDDE